MSEGNFEKREQPEYSLHSFISSSSRCDDNHPPRSSDGLPLEMKMMGSSKRSPSWSLSLRRPSLNKPYLRYYAVGPSTYQILCPLCQQRSATQTVELIGIFGPFTCLLSSLSWCVLKMETTRRMERWVKRDSVLFSFQLFSIILLIFGISLSTESLQIETSVLQ